MDRERHAAAATLACLPGTPGRGIACRCGRSAALCWTIRARRGPALSRELPRRARAPLAPAEPQTLHPAHCSGRRPPVRGEYVHDPPSVLRPPPSCRRRTSPPPSPLPRARLGRETPPPTRPRASPAPPLRGGGGRRETTATRPREPPGSARAAAPRTRTSLRKRPAIIIPPAVDGADAATAALPRVFGHGPARPGGMPRVLRAEPTRGGSGSECACSGPVEFIRRNTVRRSAFTPRASERRFPPPPAHSQRYMARMAGSRRHGPADLHSPKAQWNPLEFLA